MKKLFAVSLASFLAIALGVVAAQRAGGFGRFSGFPFQALPNTPYDGRFTFVRVNYETAPGGYW